MKELVIDVSHWNGDIDLAAWKSRRGVWGVIVKAGGYEKIDGVYQQYRDPKFEANYRKAREAGLHVGAYYYDVCTTMAQARRNAGHFASLLGGKAFDLPLYMDVEDRGQLALSKRVLTDVIRTFCDTLAATGRRAGVYTGGSAWMNNMHRSELYGYANWIAAWRRDWPSYAEDGGKIGMWQQGSMRLSDGRVAYGWVDGYVDCDWCVVDYPNGASGGSTQMGNGTRATTLTVAERIAQMATYIARTDTHGYSQPNRMGWGGEEVRFSDSTSYVIHQGDYDCSEMARTCANAGLGKEAISYMWSGDADGKLRAAGFRRLAFSVGSVRRGDILWKSGHMGVALGDGMQADAHGDEVGGITGPRAGDQTGHEIEVRALRTSWVYAYRHDGGPKVAQVPGTAANGLGLRYRAHCQGIGWCDSVHDGQVAGTVGYGRRLEAIKITPPDGVELEVLLHIQSIGDKTYKGIRKGKSSGTGSSATDPIMGTVGKGKRIEGISVEVTKNANAKLKGKQLYYRVHQQKVGWTKWCKAGSFCGSRGRGLRVEAIQMVFR